MSEVASGIFFTIVFLFIMSLICFGAYKGIDKSNKITDRFHEHVDDEHVISAECFFRDGDKYKTCMYKTVGGKSEKVINCNTEICWEND